MNYLAHLFLAGGSPESLIGNLAGDFVKGALGDRFTPGIREGIMQHRRIDAFTDPTEFKRQIDDWIRTFRATRPAPVKGRETPRLREAYA